MRNGLGDFRPTYGVGNISNWTCTDVEDVI